MSIISISAVSYTNTKPFVFGLTQSAIFSKIHLSLDFPARCAQKVISREVDLGLIPVAVLPELVDYYLISDYCIGAHGAVNSVFIFSDKPLDEVQTIRLDPQSRTSNQLAKVLLKYHWQLLPNFVTDGPADAYVEIGDRTFGKADQVRYAYDLSAAWTEFTGLPFVFAVWAASKPICEDFIVEFNAAIKYGLDNINKVIAELPKRSNFNLEHYLTYGINYRFDELKKQALKQFLDLVKTIELPIIV